MTVSAKDWSAYIKKLSALNEKAAAEMRDYVTKNGFSDMDELIDVAYGLATKYGEGAAALSSAMYDAIADLSGRLISPAVPAETASYQQVARTVQGVANTSQNPNSIGNAVGRLVKQAGADTTLKNALRDGAEFAWIPSGDTCAFCLTLASRGWQRASKAAIKGGHAEHIHANCDCTYAIRFDGKSGVKGYDPERYKRIYLEAEGTTPQETINAIRREQYAKNKDEINTQKRAAYAERMEREALTGDVNSGIVKMGTESIIELASHNMHNSSDVIYDRTKHVPPIQGYDDVFIHADPWGVSTKDANGNDIDIPNEGFLRILRSMTFENDSIRLCACEAGAADDGIASYVAEEMNMPVMASTTHVWIPFPDKDGISRMELYADNGTGFPDYNHPGKWRVFNPDGSIVEVKE